MRFSAKCSERNSFHEKASVYSLFCCWQVSSSKTVLIAASLRQVCERNKVYAKPNFSLAVYVCDGDIEDCFFLSVLKMGFKNGFGADYRHFYHKLALRNEDVEVNTVFE